MGPGAYDGVMNLRRWGGKDQHRAEKYKDRLQGVVTCFSMSGTAVRGSWICTFSGTEK
jgi:hypothetical protein